MHPGGLTHNDFVIWDYFCTEILFNQETIGNLIIQQQKTGHTWGRQQLIHTGLHVGLVVIKDCVFLDSFVLIVVEPLDLLFTLHPAPLGLFKKIEMSKINKNKSFSHSE